MTIIHHTITVKGPSRWRASPVKAEPYAAARVTVELTIDVAGLAKHLGELAWHSRGNKAVLGGGLIKAKVLR